MVNSDSYGCAVFFAQVDEGYEFFSDFFKLGSVFLVGKFHFSERASRVEKITGVNAHFFNVQGGLKGCCRIEMNVCNERNLHATGTHTAMDLGKVL